MAWLRTSEPILRLKQKQLDVQDLCGLLRIHWKIRQKTLISLAYTRIDQVFLLWGLIAIAIFATAQFLPISWHSQAIAWSMVTIIGTVGMACLSDFWVKVEQLRWVVYFWAGLMAVGLVITDIGIFCGIGTILINLCPLWLGLSAVGYIGMGLGMGSLAFILTGVIHLLSICFLPWAVSWQFLYTGLVMTSCLLILAELQWDMGQWNAIELDQSAILTAEEINFNRSQKLLRKR